MRTIKILLLLLFFSSTIFAQKIEEKEDPKSLMSSYYDNDFNPFKEGNWMVSYNMSFKKEDYQNSNLNFENVINGTRKQSNYQIGGAYFFSDNFAGKLGFVVGRETFEGKIGKTLDTINRTSNSKSYAIAPSLRSAIPLSANQRLSLFVDLTTQFGWGDTEHNERGKFGDNEKSYSDEYLFGAGIKSGLTFFAMQNFAVEVGLDILSYKYTSSKTNNFDEPESKYETHEVDFSIDLLSLNLALTYYIGAK